MKRDFACSATRFGKLIHERVDRCIGRSLINYGEWAPGETALLSQLISDGDCILDVGANIGFHTLFFSLKAGKYGRVLAFEPDRLNHQMLQFNTVINDFQNVIIYNCLVGRQSSVVMFWQITIEENNRAGLSYELTDRRSTKTRPDPLMQIAIDDLELERCNLIKIDVEGFEQEVFLGATETLQRLRPIVFFEQKSENNFHEILEILAYRNYDSFWSVSNAYPKFNIRNNKIDFFKGNTETNILAIPKEKVGNYQTILGDLEKIKNSLYSPPNLSQLDDKYWIKSSELTEAEIKWAKLFTEFFRSQQNPNIENLDK